MNKRTKYAFLITLTTAVVLPAVLATLSPRDKAKSKPKDVKIKSEPEDRSVFDRNLVEEEPSPKDILIENAAYYKDTSRRLFNGTILGYVTPWNGGGYDVAKIWKNKFDIISPVWLQIVPKELNKYGLAGTHDIDEGWMKELKKANTKIFPRVIFDKFTEKDVTKLLSEIDQHKEVSDLLAEACVNYKFDGYVLEVWTQFGPQFKHEPLLNLIIKIANTLKQVGCEAILVIPPKRGSMPNLFSSRHFEIVYPHFYAFSLMTYDYSSFHRPGANAPLYWMQESVEFLVPGDTMDYKAKRSKILMGLNMYGNDYTPDGGHAIIGAEFLNLLKHYKKRLIHDERDKENFFEIKNNNGRHMVFYPTLYSINERIKLARELGVGLAIWELGQGLLYFYDLF